MGAPTYSCGTSGVQHSADVSVLLTFSHQGLVLPIPKMVPPKDPDAVTTLKNLKDKVQSEIQKYRKSGTNLRPQRLPHINDFSRLARRICGKSIVRSSCSPCLSLTKIPILVIKGVVLGGGGARGMSHLVRCITLCNNIFSRSSRV
jgi:hypothetical protein